MKSAIEQTQTLSGVTPKTRVNLGGVDNDAFGGLKVWIVGTKRRVTDAFNKKLKCHNALEPAI